MSRTKQVSIAAVALLFAGTVALAAAHFIKCSGSQQGNTFVTSFKIAGLGNEQTCVTVTGDATAVYACYNNGGKNPSAANKRTVNQQVTATDCFTPRNGQITGTLTLTAPGPGTFSCPPGQTLRLESVSFANVTVNDTTHNLTCNP